MGIRGKDPDNENIKHLQKISVSHVGDCKDCGRESVRNRRVLHTRHTHPFFHWRSKCNCGRYQHPVTGEWMKCDAYTLNRGLTFALKETKKTAKQTK